MNEAEQWWNGPPWLFDPSLWPANIVTKATDNSNAEKVQRELFALDFLTPNSLLFLNANILPELEPHRHEDRGLRTRAKFLKAT